MMVDHELTEDEEWRLMTYGYGSEATYLTRTLVSLSAADERPVTFLGEPWRQEAE